MIAAVLPAMPLAADLFSSRTLGEAVLITVAAIVLGYGVAWFWPKHLNPSLFGSLAAIAMVGGLAYLGSTGATLAIGVVTALGVLATVVSAM